MVSRSSAAIAATGVVLLSAGVFASDVYDPPPAYYAPTAGLVGAPLRNALHVVISTGHVTRSYDAARFALPILDRDPNDASRIILVYNGASVPATWDAGATWNREHTWPDSRGLGGSGMDYSDLHQLRGCNPSINGSRGNDPFGNEFGPGGSSSYWDPDRFGVAYRGEMARAMMYMDVRYDGGDAGTTDLVLVNGFPSGNQMGDLAAMLEWHFQQPASPAERRRNHFVYSSAANPTYFQGNRNPFVDHPEFVWALFGPTPNSSTLSVAAPLPDGSSSAIIDLGDYVAGAPDAQALVTISKLGATPTTFELSTTGDAALAFDGRRQAFVSGPQQRSVSVTLTNLGSPGVRAGTLVVDNTDLTSAGPGQGAQDGDDTVTFLALVVDGANPSFSPVDDENGASIDLTGASAAQIEVHNIASPPAAGLDLDVISGSGDTDAFEFDAATFSGVPAGGSRVIQVAVAPGAPSGLLEAVYTLQFSDADLPGAQPREPLTLIVRASVSACDADLDGDGQVSASDLAALLGAWGAGGGPADLDGDGQVAASDLAGVLGAWGPCP
jgi:endonuclease I